MLYLSPAVKCCWTMPGARMFGITSRDENGPSLKAYPALSVSFGDARHSAPNFTILMSSHPNPGPFEAPSKLLGFTPAVRMLAKGLCIDLTSLYQIRL